MLIVTPGGIDSNSYVSLAEAEAFAPTFMGATWPDDDEAQEAALIEATRVADSYFSFVGTIATDEQALRWPRKGAFDADGRELSDTEIPNALKRAVFRLALYLNDNTGLTMSDSAVTSLKVGSISLAFGESSSVSLPQTVIAAFSQLGEYIGPSTGSIQFASLARV